MDLEVAELNIVRTYGRTKKVHGGHRCQSQAEVQQAACQSVLPTKYGTNCQ